MWVSNRHRAAEEAQTIRLLNRTQNIAMGILQREEKECVIGVVKAEEKADYRKRGLQKMLDTKNEQKWPLIVGLQLQSRVTSIFGDWFKCAGMLPALFYFLESLK